ncbi:MULTISPECIES: HalOD1 output domain-containing protein [Halorussus]|uniref:HalOD1 output domain-containing protein n=1 Tax=Halorussus TaxID=1070314 RepID=UPI001F04714C|nr:MULTISPECIES: HalOD1 output domain-containing protein [Halorussus]
MSKTETHTVDAVEYESETPLRMQADWSGTETLDSAITCAISRATGETVTELAPLYEYMDPDALHEFVASMRDRETETSITFQYEGHDVTVRSDGEIMVWPPR